MRIRKSVYALDTDDDTLDWYRQAVDAMSQKPVEDPTSWYYMGAVHGNPFNGVPSGAQGFWDQCAHASWFFLSWHRMYLGAFEAMVAKTVEELGGPSEWALPYWNYSQDPTEEPRARLLPEAFRDSTLPDGTPNALFSQRFAVTNGDFGLDDSIVTLDALNADSFSDPNDPTENFGGLPPALNPFSNSSGRLEMRPHNVIHTSIGGFMQDPRTAAFDPIFWLHHCNIDRLWEVWRRADPTHVEPVEPAWRTGTQFAMHNADGLPFTFNSEQTLDTTKVLHGYVYDEPPATPPLPPTIITPEAVFVSDPELVGRSSEPVRLVDAVTEATVELAAPTESSFLQASLPDPVKVMLVLENVRAAGVAADFRVLVSRASSDEIVEAGVLATFGIARASDPDRDHGGTGLTQAYDITFAADTLGLKQEAAPMISVRFERITRPTEALTEAPAAMAEILGATASTQDAEVEVERIALYFR